MNLIREDYKEQFEMIIFYGIPAYGHIHPTLPIVNELVQRGYHVVYYATKEFQELIESHGAEFREYHFDGVDWNPQVGSQILELTELVLRFTAEQMDELMEEAKVLQPKMIFHDTIAFWGRVVASSLDIKAVCVNTLISISGYGSKAFRLYATRFTGSSFSQWKSIPNIIKYKKKVKKKWKGKPDDWVSILMNSEKFNVYTYSCLMHPDEKKLGTHHFFLGPTSLLRSGAVRKEDWTTDKPLIYVSLGTIFNNSQSFYQEIIKQFGDTKYQVVISSKSQYEMLSEEALPSNIIIKPYVSQIDVLQEADLFVTAGGMNSICEAVSSGVPCLVYPQQGEQDINGMMMERLGFGRRLKRESNILETAEQLLETHRTNPKLIEEFSAIHMQELMKRLEEY